MKTEKCKWFRLLAFVPLLCILVATNMYQDPANIFHDESNQMAEAIMEGNTIYSETWNGNEREVRRNMIMVMPDEVECVAVGPSLIMCVNKEVVGTESFINLGVPGADLYDIMAQFGLMEIHGKKPERVILCVDSYFFDENIYGVSGQHDDLKEYADYMLAVLDDENPQVPTVNTSPVSKQVEQAFSITYFQASIEQIAMNGTYVMNNERWGVVTSDYDGAEPCYADDGSWIYAKSYQENNLEYIQNAIQTYNIEKQFMYDRHMSQYGKDVFEKLINYLLAEGIEVDLFLSPVTPGIWDRLEAESEHYTILQELNDYAYDIANRYDLNVIGSYNPYDLELSNEDFYDARHVRRELLGEYFDFTAQKEE